MQQKKFVLIDSMRAVHQRNIRIRQQKLDLLPVGKEIEGPHLDLLYAWSVAEPRLCREDFVLVNNTLSQGE